MSLHYQLATLRKGDNSIADYYHKFTTLIDTLVVVDQPLPHHETISFLLAGLGSDYDALVTSVSTQLTPIALEDLYDHLLSHELRLSHNQPSVDLSTASANFVNKNSSNRGERGGRTNNFSASRGRNQYFNHRGRGRGRHNYSQSSNRPFCQVCQKPGHVALQCYHRFDNTYQYDNSSQMKALLATPQQPTDPNWYLDSGATHHVTSDLANLNIRAEEYQGSEQIHVGNGISLPIHHIGTTQLSTPTTTFHLNNVLYVPDISNNLLSVHKFTNDTNTFMEFHPSRFCVKDLASRRPLLQGPSKHGLYPFPFHPTQSISTPRALFGERTSLTNWHSCLGHPAFRIVSSIISRFGLPTTANKNELACSACLSAKSKQLPFHSSHSQINTPLELIYSDLWGPSPVCSRTGHKYFISFLDAYSRYTWLFPISHKNDAISIFIQFQRCVERYFNLKIKSVQTDWGGEFRSTSKFFLKSGIAYRVSCPHTHQQNGAIERKHRHIVETGLALLYHASVPLRFWDDAFQTAYYLINRLPTPILHHQSPFEKLFQAPPDYSLLKIFGSACWPNLHPYNTNKLQPRSLQCVFLGYSLRHKGYKCFHVSTGRLYISRDVIFQETTFPFFESLSKSPPKAPPPTTSILGLPPALLQPMRATAPFNRMVSQAQSATPHRPTTSPDQHLTVQPHQIPTSLDQQPTTQNKPSLEHAQPINTSSSLSSNSDTASSSPIPSTKIPNPPLPNHPMVTRSKNHISKPKHPTDGTIRYPLPRALVAVAMDTTALTEPNCFTSASKNPKWRQAMNSEFDALLKNNT